jgi:hypothetical protein
MKLKVLQFTFSELVTPAQLLAPLVKVGLPAVWPPEGPGRSHAGWPVGPTGGAIPVTLDLASFGPDFALLGANLVICWPILGLIC